MKNNEYQREDFIRVYDNFVDDQYCNKIINFFEWCLENNRTFGRDNVSNLSKKDNALSLNTLSQISMSYSFDMASEYVRYFNSRFWDEAWPLFRKDFPVLNDFEKHTIVTYKIQKTLPSEGYHIWHSETGSLDFMSRFAVYILYLNTLLPEQGGETEFLYQQKRIAPQAGTLVLFPAAYTHVHRGNPPMNATKYIMTGWIELC